MNEPEVKRLSPGESRQHDEKGDPIDAVTRKRLRGRIGWTRKRNIRFGKNGPEDEVYVRSD